LAVIVWAVPAVLVNSELLMIVGLAPLGGP